MAKKYTKNFKIFVVIAPVVAVLLLIVTILANTVFFDLFCTLIGGKRPIFEGGEPIYSTVSTSKEDALERAKAKNLEVCEEGTILLKNSGALPLAKGASVSVFGKNSVNLAYGGSGSGGGSSDGAIDLYSSLRAAGFSVNETLENFYKSSASGNAREANPSDLDSGKPRSIATAETPQSKYTSDVKASYSKYNDAAIVVFTRIGGEGFDLPRTMAGAEGAYDESDHYLRLDRNERELIDAVNAAGFEKVVVLINAGTSMELGLLEDNSGVDAILQMGFPGINGASAIGKILCGEINPSGKTPDIYAADFTRDPVWNNFGEASPGSDKYAYADDEYHFVHYEEGIYVGYRYYETRFATEANGEEWYAENIVYPFGYGLSYTSFEWQTDASEISGKAIEKGEKYTVKVTVTNRGEAAGKDVVEIYGGESSVDGANTKIEKASKVLLGFAKTKLLQPGESDTVEIEIDPYYLSSYDYRDGNADGIKGYELEEGTYSLYISTDSHNAREIVNFTVPAGFDYVRDPVTNYEVKNLYTDNENEWLDSDRALSTVLSRKSWTETWPTAPTEEDRQVTDEFIKTVIDKSHNNPNTELYEEMELPYFGVDGTLSLRDLLSDAATGEFVGYPDYDDERWEELLDECNFSDLQYLFNYGAFKSEAIGRIGKPLTNDTDGPAGFINFMDKSGTYYGTCLYCCETVMSATWNAPLIEELGQCVGEEGIWGAADRGNHLPYSGWYAPGMNTHRSPFGGRNFEYFSEDPVLSGKMAAAEIRGCRAKGVYCFMKHFALNEQETFRAIGGNMSWVTEQAMREIYLKPFEIAVKEGGANAAMSSFNRIGARWTGGDYRLLTEILRNEWGFRGMVICDFNTHPEYMISKQMAYAGGDINLATMPVTWGDDTSNSDAIIMRQCAKNVLYTVASSNAMNSVIVGYSLPVWDIVLIVIDSAAAVGLIVWGFFAVKNRRRIKSR